MEPRNNGTSRNYEELDLKHADNIAAYFFITCAVILILGSFLISLLIIVNAITDQLQNYFLKFFFSEKKYVKPYVI